ncbi:LysR family transcriptional regulator [Cupriavidus gilardii]|uniref:LysR substrate-binding domain-containing protein n=1 Tax=Cupriavidus gilardii TaxID=82541 RepID=UPI001EE57FF8|nr:LysR substrate-binding domain-containing protein [Cupriavidus gilardii]MCG5262639.1 LysR substrate-binding domain-containing protein [Cupriavidus gilardii]MDF9430027.1 LysR family transcriptional regulator [Cupriavidus gilardii]
MAAAPLSASLLAWLRCFEAAARHHSFTRAAGELCVTQGAVSQQVKQLEQWLGRPLFLRTPRALVLTPEGERLRGVLRESFEAIEGALAQLRRRGEAGPVSLSCSPSFAMRWLTPRLGSFFRDHPDLALRVHGEFQALDRGRMLREGIDAAVRFDPGAYRDVHARRFLDEWLLPVASPAFAAAHPELRSPADLRGALLLHDASPWDGAGEFEEWSGWLQQAGVTVPDLQQGQRFNLSQLAIGAALAGQGVAMGRAALVLDDLEAGRLVDLFGVHLPSPAAYHFVSASDRSPEVAAIESWLEAEGARFEAAWTVWLARADRARKGRRASPRSRRQPAGAGAAVPGPYHTRQRRTTPQ